MPPKGSRKTHCKRGHSLAGYAGGCRICRDMTIAEWGHKHPERIKYIQKKSWLAPQGWTPETFEDALLEQKNLCAICNKEMKRANADHEHVIPPKPRAILCSTCNWGLGQFYDSPDLLRAAAVYIEKFKEKDSECPKQNMYSERRATLPEIMEWVKPCWIELPSLEVMSMTSA